MGRQPKIVPPRRPNPLRDREKRAEIRAPTIFTQKAAAVAAAAAKSKLRKRGCPNPTCEAPNIEDGICQGCGRVVDDSNIVAEVQFGESSSGAAVVQGSFMGADQGAAKSMGPGFRRAGGSEEGREGTIREGRRIMQAMANQLQIQETIVAQGVQIFKLAAMHNFIQGRRMEMVCAVCLYSACRQTKPCRVMLIDFADKIQVNVFKLGRTFKALHHAVTFARNGIFPVLPEDLIWRFAAKLEFGDLCDKVAEDAVRMVKRMSLDWMVMGRRPSGVCGACLILAARMNNFRRTITEVVYVVKVTTHTIQKRLDEFKLTPSSALTVDEFLNNEFLESAHDPPSFYEKSEDFQKNKTKRKRKRKGEDGAEGDDEDVEDAEADGSPNKRRKSNDQVLPSVELRRDADGFAIPATPALSHTVSQSTESSDTNQTNGTPDNMIDPDLVDDVIREQTGTSMNLLVETFGDAVGGVGQDEVSDTSPAKKGRAKAMNVRVPAEWERDENQMIEEVSEMVSDPNSVHHAISYARATKRAAEYLLLAEQNQKFVSMDVHIGEDEFAEDPEVQNCVLSPDDVARKEKVWVNENKSWLRQEQIKAYKRKLAENGPPKARRNRKKKPRMGEGQLTPAASPADAAVEVLKARAFSKKINYDAIRGMFDDPDIPQASNLTSAATSQVGSRAGSELESVASVTLGENGLAITAGTAQSEMGDTVASTVDEESDEDDLDHVRPDDDTRKVVVEEEEEEEDDWKAAFKRKRGDDEEGFDDDEEEYPDLGYGDDEPNFDDVGAFDGPEDYDEY
ncbi:Uncharacterized protein BP5553_02288 [Venustampulla echinocandica]|uniref:B-related factor 1 n=1 Tax=Venustampulla echinocandica TaxID=2656787 RepID=A0A370U3F2_9HELO|nr:Uncharacterized protein BP5553_02288 [Venustampulla echinocandica]RDL42309.1 Uncharacterized protein BP5553_02288 [Venustampulla echinocandica]